MKRKLIVIAGPTAVGKSRIAAELGRKTDGEIISADSMQVYKTMDIGSAKITLEEMLGVPHHMIDVADPREDFDVVRYADGARKSLQEIYSRGRLPILCGGTGFYIQALTRDIDFTETGSLPAYREELRHFAETYGNNALFEKLRAADPESCLVIHPNNIKRVIRALEYYKETGETISAHNKKEKEKDSPYDLLYFVINEDRSVLYKKIDRRVDFMLQAGLIEEVSYLKAQGLTRDMVSMQGLGYKEIMDYLDGKCTLPEAEQTLKQNTRHYAKRQLTWFKREKDAIWINREDFGNDVFQIVDYIIKTIHEDGG